MHLTVCINGTGFHPAGWRSTAPAPLSASLFRSLAALAESGGFAAALFGMSFFDENVRSSGRVPIVEPDALPLVSSLIAHTETIGLGVAVPLERGEPYNIARSFATLDRLSLGRTAWLVDISHAGGDYGRHTECIEVVRKLWDSWEDGAFVVDKPKGWVANSSKVHRIDHAGPNFTVRGPLNVPRPTQGHPVLAFIDPGDAAGRSLAARFADLFIVNCADSDTAGRIRQTMRSSAASVSRNPDALKVVMNVFPVLGSTEAEALRTDAELSERVDATLAAALVQGQPGGSEPSVLAAGRELAGHLCGLRFVGTPEQLADRLAELHAADICDGFNIVPAVLPDDLRLFADRTIASLRRKNIVPAQQTGRTLRDRLGLQHPRSRYVAAEAQA